MSAAKEEEKNDDNEEVVGDSFDGEEHHQRHSYYLIEQKEILPYYIKPSIRHIWGEKQGHLHTNWGDIFFDLFFVSAAYNLGNLLKYQNDWRGILYFLGTLAPLQNVWQFQMFYDARYKVRDDVVHRIFELLFLAVIGVAVLSIQPVYILSHGTKYNEMFTYACSIFGLNIMTIFRMVEIYFFATNSEGGNAKNQALLDISWIAVSVLFSLVATVVSGVIYYQNGHSTYSTTSEADYGSYADTNAHYGDDDHYDEVYTEDYASDYKDEAHTYDKNEGHHYEDDKNITNNTTQYLFFNIDMSSIFLQENEENHTEGHVRRFLRTLAGSSSSSTYEDGGYDKKSKSNDIAIWLLLVGFLVSQIYYIILAHRMYNKRRNIVPMNINFCIHRYGEWTMLMLGEGVLSLLIVHVEKKILSYIVTFYSGILTMIALQYIHFRSQPHDPEKHALRRSVLEAAYFNNLFQMYSAALICLGACYKMFLYEYTYAPASSHDSDEHHRNLSLKTILFQNQKERSLAGAGPSPYNVFFNEHDTEQRLQRISLIFCTSMTIIWVSTELMILSHNGRKAIAKMKKGLKNHRYLHSKQSAICATSFISIRVLLILFMATLPSYINNSNYVAEITTFVTMVATTVQLLLRFLGEFVFPDNQAENANRRTVNYYIEKQTINWLNVSSPLGARQSVMLNNAQESNDHNNNNNNNNSNAHK